MSNVTEILSQMRAKNDALVQRLSVVPEEQMGAMASWGQRQMPIRTMFYQLLTHELEHTVHVVKTLRDLGIAPTEAQLILGQIQEASGRLEGLLVGLSDEDLDRAPGDEWSLRQVLEHIMGTKDSYVTRLEQAVIDSA